MVAQKTWMIIGVVAVLVIIGLFAFSGNDSSTSIDSQEAGVGSESGEAMEDDSHSGEAMEKKDGDAMMEKSAEGEAMEEGQAMEKKDSPLWLTAELTDVLTGETFTVNDFAGTPVLLESFAVWCPKCTSQQRTVRDLHEELGDGFISVALNTDPNEDADRVRQHAESQGFDWRYVVSPTDVTQSLIDSFGVGVVNAPSVPMILICGDGSYKKLQNGAKSVDTLKGEIEACG